MKRHYTAETALGRVVTIGDIVAMQRDFMLWMLYQSTNYLPEGQAYPLELQSLCNVSGLDLDRVYGICSLLCSDGYVAFSEPEGKKSVALTTKGGVYIETLPGIDKWLSPW